MFLYRWDLRWIWIRRVETKRKSRVFSSSRSIRKYSNRAPIRVYVKRWLSQCRWMKWFLTRFFRVAISYETIYSIFFTIKYSICRIVIFVAKDLFIKYSVTVSNDSFSVTCESKKLLLFGNVQDECSTQTLTEQYFCQFSQKYIHMCEKYNLN